MYKTSKDSGQKILDYKTAMKITRGNFVPTYKEFYKLAQARHIWQIKRGYIFVGLWQLLCPFYLRYTYNYYMNKAIEHDLISR